MIYLGIDEECILLRRDCWRHHSKQQLFFERPGENGWLSAYSRRRSARRMLFSLLFAPSSCFFVGIILFALYRYFLHYDDYDDDNDASSHSHAHAQEQTADNLHVIV